MIYTLTINQVFAAGHKLTDHPRCGKVHGHTYRLDVTVVGDPDVEMYNMVANEEEVRGEVAALVHELDGRFLNEQIPAFIPSAQGVANWVWERLALRFQLYEVTVWQDDLRASISRE